MKVNFKQLEIYTDIAKTHKMVVDARKDLSNILYNGCTGIVAHNVALKVFNSEDAIEINSEEAQLITETAEKYCTPAFIDALKSAMSEQVPFTISPEPEVIEPEVIEG